MHSSANLIRRGRNCLQKSRDFTILLTPPPNYATLYNIIPIYAISTRKTCNSQSYQCSNYSISYYLTYMWPFVVRFTIIHCYYYYCYKMPICIYPFSVEFAHPTNNFYTFLHLSIKLVGLSTVSVFVHTSKRKHPQ